MGNPFKNLNISYKECEQKMTRRRRNTNRKMKKILSGIITLIIIGIAGLLGTNQEFVDTISNAGEESEKQQVEFVAQEDLLIDFIDVGQADSILIRNQDKTMLIDAGTNEAGETVVNYLKNLGITQIDYLIGTHPHEDHIGGLDDVISQFDIGQIYMPKIETTTKTFEDVLDAIEAKNSTITSPNKGDTLEIGQAQGQFMTDPILDEDNLNLSSLVIRIEFGNTSFLFMGDAEEENEKTISWPKTDVLKVGHHGSSTSSSDDFLQQVQPKYAVIMVGEGNSYGLPKQETIDKLNKLGTQIYRTDEDGTIQMTSDGNEIETN